MIYADHRWIGNHGIGRFARRVLQQLSYCPIALGGHPAAPLDTWRLTNALRSLTAHDLFFSPGYNTPLWCPAPFVFTIHDLSHIYCPENSSSSIKLYYGAILKRACHRAASILTVSEFTRSQIVEWSGVIPEKVINVGCGVDPAYQHNGGRFGLAFHYLLCVSNRKRHKNEFRVVQAFARSGVSPVVHLVFTGQPTSELADHIATQGVVDSVHFAGSVPESKLPSLYRGAEALVFPSLYEGFGLPVLEAMACGIPVVTSSLTAMPEIADGAALLVDPTSVDEIARAIWNVTNDLSLRQELRKRGLRRAAQFSWITTGEAVRQALAANKAALTA